MAPEAAPVMIDMMDEPGWTLDNSEAVMSNNPQKIYAEWDVLRKVGGKPWQNFELLLTPRAALPRSLGKSP
jgi:hypothetical protein